MPRDFRSSLPEGVLPLTSHLGSRPLKALGLNDINESSKDDSGVDKPSEDPTEGLPESLLKANERNNLHPYVRPLTLADVDSCVKLETAAFSENERTPRDKIVYRLTKCPELSLGLFTTAGPDSAARQAATSEAGKSEFSEQPEKKAVLLAHALGARLNSPVVTDESMMLPPNWDTPGQEDSQIGHISEARTVAIHALAVLPEYQRKGLGKVIVKSYVQRMQHSGAADRMALLCRDHLIPFYESCGFKNSGRSEAQKYGGNWNDMTLEFDSSTPSSV
ncbi:acyl-CoA N-acyltransferase [Xylona heveae TC161]|uniref:Acyl-CoA N-acyltransferase n=1 Tax=Xylona heveae (strain CBS 132557 / TC161) TaxID=1328760 RepID=A0A165ITN1_XYLHT|nr:acyl-CoA N-acyltransferase [Xylona heveae TC161]KZF25373.1 acyl-CoA N-acyltransferase [Xylona heveae TC161]